MSKSQRTSYYWRIALAMTAAVVIFYAGAYSAGARSAQAPGSTLSYTGILLKDELPLTGQQELLFSFKKAGQSICSSTRLQVTPDSAGRFQVLIPLSNCPSSLFDGTAVTVDISVGSDVAARDVAVTSVPYALHAEHLGTADCPTGYERDSIPSTVPNAIGCVRGEDHVIRVGAGASAFWIDRYEASIWSDTTPQGTQYGAFSGEVPYPSTFPVNGQTRLEHQLYALSKPGVLPSSPLSWFQASRACRASGKRLPSNDEWTEAATGTRRGTEEASPCTDSNNPVHLTGQGRECVSIWGAEDMVGNVTELVAEWAFGVATEPQYTLVTPWPSAFGGAMWNVTSSTYEGNIGPMSIQRGSTGANQSDASVFATGISQTVAQKTMGFRCIIPR
jgi:sulfatase-modifying factor enzyme 1